MKFNYNDGGRSKSIKRSKQTNDCTVIALALALSMDYDIAYDFLKKMGRKSGQGFHLNLLLDGIIETGGSINEYIFKKHSFPALKGQPRMNVERFLNAYPKGIYIIRVAKHMACVKDGVLTDTHTCNHFKKCVYTAFECLKK